MQVLALFTAYTRDPQSRKQAEFQHAFARGKRLVRDGGPTEQVIILPDYGFDVVPAGGGEGLFLFRTLWGGPGDAFSLVDKPKNVVHSSPPPTYCRRRLARI